ncbi:uncharacterized protein LOC143374082 [Andrena cerasifolii]|uniref:uncharacterized protein LOC143374082 n=1 Tax=Andrena cerasifolii TaxID=2819439 RepID=UPI004037B07A
MDELNEFYRKVQMYLMQKNQECGELKFLSSRTTTESGDRIDDLCKSMMGIFEAYGIPVKEKALIDNEKCAQSYKYLLLNTKFQNQERLAEDIVSGHLVDMCPPLSSYLLMQIMWNLGYEKILIRSLLHVPFNLCTEMLGIVRKCIEELPFQRLLDSICELILTAYTKFLGLKEAGIQSTNLEESVECFLISFEEVLLLLTNPELIHLTEVSSAKKYQRRGIILKRLISTIKSCLERRVKGSVTSDGLEKLYNVTFGREQFVKCEDTLIETGVTILNEKMIDALLNKIKEIDCNIYLSWAGLDDDENNMITLQRSIGNECYYFIQFIQNDQQLSENTHLIECLQHLSSKSDPKQSSFVLSLQELCCAIFDGKRELVKELLCRYKEWDHSILDFVYKNETLLDKKDCLNLLEYLAFALRQPNEETFKELCHTVVTTILMHRDVSDIYEIVTAYLTKHDGKSYPESSHTEHAFNEFITRNSNLQTSTNLKVVLLFLLKDLKLVLTILVKITIGHPDYRNIMISANDMLLLSPFIQIREDNNQIIITSVLRTVCIENVEWNGKKFMYFVRAVLDNSVIKVQDLINNVFIPYLEADTFNAPNINSVLINIPMLLARCTNNTHAKGLTMALAKKMSFLRKNTTISKYVSSEILGQIARIVKYLVETKSYKLSVPTKEEIITGIECLIEPIDKLYFAPLWYLTQEGVSIVDIMNDYERRCFIVLDRLKEDPKASGRLRSYLSNLCLLKEDFLRHLILRSTRDEYQKLGVEFTTIYWFVFGYNEIEAYSHFLRLTVEACCLSLEYPSIGGNDLFAFLLKSVSQFCETFVLFERMQDQEKVYQSLIKNIRQLDGSVKHTPYAHLFTTCLASLNNDTQQDSAQLLQDALNSLYCFSEQCLESNYEYDEQTPKRFFSQKISNLYVNQEVISACIRVSATEAHDCVRRLNELFVSG